MATQDGTGRAQQPESADGSAGGSAAVLEPAAKWRHQALPQQEHPQPDSQSSLAPTGLVEGAEWAAVSEAAAPASLPDVPVAPSAALRPVQACGVSSSCTAVALCAAASLRPALQRQRCPLLTNHAHLLPHPHPFQVASQPSLLQRLDFSSAAALIATALLSAGLPLPAVP